MRSFYHPIFCLFCLLLAMAPFVAQAQDTPLAVEYCRQGEQALLEKKFTKAIRNYKMALEIQPELRAAQRGMGLCYELQGDFDKALKAYLEIVEKDPKFSRALYFQIGDLYYKKGQKQRAITYFTQFQRLQLLDDISFTVNGEKEVQMEQGYLERLPIVIQACQAAMDTSIILKDAKVTNLGNTINNKADEYFPFLSNDQSVLYYTRRRGIGTDEDLYHARKINGWWQSGNPVGNVLNTKLDEGMSTLVRDGRRMIFTACKRENVSGTCDLWEAILVNNEITEVHPLEGNPNSDKWESQASISCDGSTLYFASNRNGGQGGTDIWYSKKMPNGKWSEPKNMGPVINTKEDEESPYITNDGKTLFFASFGHLSLGEEDIFMSNLQPDGDWSQPANLGPQINSPFRELCFFLTADGRTGYFASDRPEGEGGMDIYRAEFQEELNSTQMTFVEAYVIDSLTEKPLKTVVELEGRDPVASDAQGRFFLCLPANSHLNTKIGIVNYRPFQKGFLIPVWENKQFYRLELRVAPIIVPKPPKPVVEEQEPDTSRTASKIRKMERYFHTILFKFDSDEEEMNEMDELDVFIKDLAGKDIQRVEINGYADEIGEDRYNLELSEKRAKKIAFYLVQKGYLVSRIAMKGNGEVRDAKQKALNRKVELKIVTLE